MTQQTAKFGMNEAVWLANTDWSERALITHIELKADGYYYRLSTRVRQWPERLLYRWEQSPGVTQLGYK